MDPGEEARRGILERGEEGGRGDEGLRGEGTRGYEGGRGDGGRGDEDPRGESGRGTPPALTPKVEVTEEEPAPGPLLPYPPGFEPKVEDGGASHSTPPPLPPAAGKGPSNASQVILAMKYTSFVRCKSSESVHILIYEKE